jgi:hypothetical protein
MILTNRSKSKTNIMKQRLFPWSDVEIDQPTTPQENQATLFGQSGLTKVLTPSGEVIILGNGGLSARQLVSFDGINIPASTPIASFSVSEVPVWVPLGIMAAVTGINGDAASGSVELNLQASYGGDALGATTLIIPASASDITVCSSSQFGGLAENSTYELSGGNYVGPLTDVTFDNLTLYAIGWYAGQVIVPTT